MVELMPLARLMKFQTTRFLAPISRLKHSSLWRFYTTCEQFQVGKQIPKLQKLYLYDLPELAEPQCGVHGGVHGMGSMRGMHRAHCVHLCLSPPKKCLVHA